MTNYVEPWNRTVRDPAQEQFVDALEVLETVSDFARPDRLRRLLVAAIRLLSSPGGPEWAVSLAPRFDAAGIFAGTDWDRPARLQAALVRAALTGPDDTCAIELLSRLRLLAVAEGAGHHPDIDAVQAKSFLTRSLVKNLDLLQADRSEAGRAHGERQKQVAVRNLLRFELLRLGGVEILPAVVAELDRLLEQRPIDTSPIRELMRQVKALLETEPEPDHPEALARAHRLLAAVDGPTPLTRSGFTDCVAQLEGLDANARVRELETLGQEMKSTGLVSAVHATILSHLAANGSLRDMACVLGLDAVGRASLDAYQGLVRTLIRQAVRPASAQCIYGLGRMLDRGILFFPPVAPALWRLTGLEPLPEVARQLATAWGEDDAPDARGALLAGVVSVLGLPLGVGQGNNPTCQSARAISLWAQVDPGFLLELVMWAARDGEIDLHFEGDLIRSSELTEGLIEDFHTELDTVSLVLVPHLDKIYWEMGRRTVGRGEDGHRWINLEFHGWWVHRGFASAIDFDTGAVIDFSGFIRRFHAAYHPAYNGGANLIYPQPAGIVATDALGNFVGWHAIAIQRVTLDSEGEMRVYFYNPNNEGRQDWGQGIVTSTQGRGEFAGESSLPFEQFCARLYVFHFNERELGPPEAVDEDRVQAIGELVRASWAREKAWHELIER